MSVCKPCGLRVLRLVGTRLPTPTLIGCSMLKSLPCGGFELFSSQRRERLLHAFSTMSTVRLFFPFRCLLPQTFARMKETPNRRMTLAHFSNHVQVIRLLRLIPSHAPWQGQPLAEKGESWTVAAFRRAWLRMSMDACIWASIRPPAVASNCVDADRSGFSSMRTQSLPPAPARRLPSPRRGVRRRGVCRYAR